ncbi:MAG: tetratricopeptide repeat protein [bacterium]|nr:MAG: tetratricopeptide repeat protein [bacterium]
MRPQVEGNADERGAVDPGGSKAYRKVRAMRWRPSQQTIVVLVLIAVSALVFVNSLQNGFVYDDHGLIEQNEMIRGWKSTFDELTLYRPVRWITYALEYSVWGLNPVGFHLTNLLIHVACTVLVYLFASAILRSRVASFFAALLFALHPVHTEAVNNVANRPDLLATLFVLLAIVLYAHRGRSVLFYFTSLVAFILGLLSKEAVSLTFPLLIVAFDWYFDRTDSIKSFFRKHLRYQAPFFAILVLNLIVASYNRMISERVTEVSGHLEVSTETSGTSFAQMFGIAARAIANYVRLLILPTNLTAEYPFPDAAPLHTPAVFFSILLMIVLVACIVWSYRRWHGASFGILWVCLTLVPVANFIPLTPHFIAERYLYAPSVGFCIIVAVFLRHLYDRRFEHMPAVFQRYAALLCIAIVCVFSALMTIRRNADWESDITLWSKTVRQQPSSMIAYNNLGYAYQRAGMLDSAARAYQSAIIINPTYVMSRYNLASILAKRERYDEALEQYIAIARIDPTFVRAYYGMGSIYAWKKQTERAIEAFEEAVRRYPRYAKAHYRLGMLYRSRGSLDRGIEHLRKAVECNPADGRAHYDLAAAYLEKGLREQAMKEYRRAVEIDPRFSRPPYGLPGRGN